VTVLRNMPIPIECHDWLEQSFHDLGAKLTARAPQSHVAARMQGETTLTDHVTVLTHAVLHGLYAQAVAQCDSANADPLVGPKRIHHDLFLPAIRNVGQAWKNDTADFAQISLAFALLHRLLDRMLPDASARHRIARVLRQDTPRVLVAVAPGDTHSFGAVILTQELRLQGWSVTLRSHQENNRVLDDLANGDFAALALSVSCDESLAGLADFVTACRMSTRDPALRVVIGGAAIQSPFGQYGFLGADVVGLAIDEVATYLSRSCHIRPSSNWN